MLRDGDLYLWDGAVEKRVTHGKDLEGIAYARGRVAAIESGRVVTLDLARPRVETVSQKLFFVGRPRWLPGGRSLAAGPLLEGGDGDNGYWRIDLRTRKSKRLLAPVDWDFSVHRRSEMSPRQTTLAVGVDSGSSFNFIDILDLATFKRIRQLSGSGVKEVTDFAWLNDQTLLLASSGGEGKAVAGGIQSLDIRSGRKKPWLLDDKPRVTRICSDAAGHQIAIGHDTVSQFSASYPVFSSRISLVDRSNRSLKSLRLPASAYVCEFSPDGRSLLLLTHKPGDSANSRTISYDLKSGAIATFGKNATEAIWIN